MRSFYHTKAYDEKLSTFIIGNKNQSYQAIKFTDELEEYYKIFLKLILKEIIRQKVSKKSNPKAIPKSKPTITFKNFVELNKDMVQYFKEFFSSIYEGKCIDIINRVEDIINYIDQLPYKERIIFKLSIIKCRDLHIANHFEMKEDEIVQLKKVAALSIYEKATPDTLPYFTALLVICKFHKIEINNKPGHLNHKK